MNRHQTEAQRKYRLDEGAPPQPGERRWWDFADRTADAEIAALGKHGWQFLQSRARVVRLDASTSERRLTVQMEFVG